MTNYLIYALIAWLLTPRKKVTTLVPKSPVAHVPDRPGQRLHPPASPYLSKGVFDVSVFSNN